MGISGLLPALKSITTAKSLEHYRGQTLAVDGYCWLHRATYSCPQELCMGEPTDKYLYYFMDQVEMMRKAGVTPYIVFDGGRLPMKKSTEEERRKSRKQNKEKGMALFERGQYAEARKYFVRAVDVSPLMAHRVIQVLRERGIQYVVAPYEADAQLAFLIQNGIVDAVVTEDSDCLAFGCSTVLFKLASDGVGQEIRTEDLKKNTGLRFHMFTSDMFLEMCIFSGCDYLKSIPGFGLKRAYTAIKEHRTLPKILRKLKLEGKAKLPPSYEADFRRARLTFCHQRVYDPKKQCLVPLAPFPQGLEDEYDDLDFLGADLPADTARGIAMGDIDPISHDPFPPSPLPQIGSRHQPPAQNLSSTMQTTATQRTTISSTVQTTKTKQTTPSTVQTTGPKQKASSAPPPERKFATRLPSEFMQTYKSRMVQEKTETKSVSKYFSASQESSVSAFESQEAKEKDVATGVSLSPAMAKENEPLATEGKRETAFERMMARSAMQSKKRKASSVHTGVVEKRSTRTLTKFAYKKKFGTPEKKKTIGELVQETPEEPESESKIEKGKGKSLFQTLERFRYEE